MASVATWSTTAGNNNSASPDGFPEGMAPSGLNDGMREIMAQLKTQFLDCEWLDHNDTPTQTSATTFTISGDVTDKYLPGRGIKCYGTTMGTFYGRIVSSSYSSPNTTVTVNLLGSSLTTNLSQVYLSILTPGINNSLSAISEPTSSKSSSYTVTMADHKKTILVNAAGGSVTITLPASATVKNGFIVTIKKIDSSSNSVIIDGNSSETIDGALTKTINEQFGSFTVIADGTNFSSKNQSFRMFLPSGYISGLNMTNDTDTDHDISISIGCCIDSTNNFMFKLTTPIVKQIDASWAAGSAAGGFPTGITLSTGSWYHVYLISKPDGTIDAGFDTSTSATNLLADATGYVYYRLIGSVLSDGSSNIIQFIQKEDLFYWLEPISNYSTTLGTSSTNITLSVPTGRRVLSKLNINCTSVSNWQLYLRPTDTTDSPASLTSAPYATITNAATAGYMGTQAEVLTDTQARIAAVSRTASLSLYMATVGWKDFRGV